MWGHSMETLERLILPSTEYLFNTYFILLLQLETDDDLMS